MALEDFLGDLSGGFQGAGMGASLLGGMQTAKIGAASNPWVAGGLLAGGTALGVANAMDPNKKKAMRLNNRLGEQEAEANDLSLKSEKTKQALEAQRQRAWDQFGSMFSGYLSAMAKAKPSGMASFQQGLGVT